MPPVHAGGDVGSTLPDSDEIQLEGVGVVVAPRGGTVNPAGGQTLAGKRRWLWVGLADVQYVAWALSAAAVIKIADAVLRDAPRWVVGAWVLAAITVIFGRLGASIAFICALAVGLANGSNHIALYAWAALILAVAEPERTGRSFRVLAMSVYLFATAHKLLGGTFLGGTPIAARTGWEPPITVVLAVGAVLAQVWILILLWRRNALALPLAIALHVGIILVMSAEWLHLLQLGVFNGLMIAVVAACSFSGAKSEVHH